MQITFDRLAGWPRAFTRDRRSRNAFKASYPATCDGIEAEIEKIGGSDIMLQADIEPRDIKRDGWPRADARSQAHPGVILSFIRKGKRLHFSCDEYELWWHNLRAIMLTLEALRAVARYGCTRSDEQYEGYGRALPSTADTAAAQLPLQAAAELILQKASYQVNIDAVRRLIAEPETRKSVYSKAVLKVHPDTGGSAEAFREVQTAWKTLNG